MKIEIAKNDLKESLDIANATLGSGSDITSHFLFERIGESVFISSCNPPRVYSSIPLKHANVEGNEAFTVEGKRFMSAVNAVHGLLKIELVEKQVKITSPKGTAEFPSLDPEVFPPWREMLTECQPSVDVSSSLIYDTLNVSRPYASTDDQRRPELCMINFTGGKAFACDGFGLAMSKHDAFNGLDVKFHIKDVPPALKFLKAHDGNDLSVLKSEKAVFMKNEDGAVFGMMALPFTMPTAITQKYIEAFGWVPRRVWRIKKEELLNSIQFLTSGADDTVLKVNFIHPESETLSPPRVEMPAASGKGIMSYSLEEAPLSFELTADLDLDSITDKGEKLKAARMRLDRSGDCGEDIESFGFNHKFMKRALDVSDSILTFGCNKEGEKRGYMLFSQVTSNGVEVVSILGWMV